MTNKRTAPRQRVLKAGTIAFTGAGIDCTVRNLSKTEAALEVASVVGIPTELSVVIPFDNLNRKCRVVWRNLNRIGVAFDNNDP
jgi:PilZ domain